MKNYFESGDGQPTNQLATKWYTDLTETLNKTYKKQMELSIDMSNFILNNTISKERTTMAENFLNTKFLKSNAELFEKKFEIFSDLTKKMLGFTYGSFFNEKGTNSFTNTISESIISIYEKQIKQTKELNNYVLEILEKSPNLNSSVLIKNVRENIDNNLDASLETIKTLLKPVNNNSEYLSGTNKKVLDEISKQIDLVTKPSLSFWSDFMTSMEPILKAGQKEKSQESNMSTTKETKG